MIEHRSCRQPGGPVPRLRGRRAFTLIELMVVMFVLMVLVGLAVGVSKYVMDKSARNQTIATQRIMMAAIRAYGEEPPEVTVSPRTGKYSLESLWQELSKVPAARQIVEKLDPSVVNRTNRRFTILDGYGNAMEYRPTGGLGGGPVLISGGPDGVISDADPATDETADNIRSDGRGW